MAKIKLLIDTDILIDHLKGIKPAKELFASKEIEIYCSILSKKELFMKSGLTDSERKRIIDLLSRIRVFRIDDDINKKHLALGMRLNKTIELKFNASSQKSTTLRYPFGGGTYH